MHDIKLSENFHLSEFLKSSNHSYLSEGICLNINQIARLKFLCEMILQKIRFEFGPLTIKSGYRTPVLNRCVNGAKDSDHLHCIAADISSTKHSSEKIYAWVMNMSDLPYRQVIWYPESRFVHISVNVPGREVKKEELVFKAGKYIPYKEYT